MTKLKYADQLAEKAGLVFDARIKVEYDKTVSLPKLKEMFEAGLIEDWKLAAEYMDERDREKLRYEIETWRYREGESEESPIDILGLYFPEDKKIIIYENLCRLTAIELNLSFDELVNVVLAHEEAHAVTHLGVDRDDKIWEYFTSAFRHNKELYAQLYPYLIFEDSSPEMEVFLRLNTKQPLIYQNWEMKKDLDIDEINEEFYKIRHQVPDYPAEPIPDPIWDVTEEDIQWPSSTEQNIGITLPVGRFNVLDGGVPGRCHPILVVKIEPQDIAEVQLLRAFKHFTYCCPEITRRVLFVASHWDALAWERHKDVFKTVAVKLIMPGIKPIELIVYRDAQLECAMRDFNRTHFRQFTCIGKDETFRRITPQGWEKAGVHYEFLLYREEKKIGIELHVETKRASAKLHYLLYYYQIKLPCINGQFIDYDPDWYNNNGRIYAKFPLATNPRILADAMKKLIKSTYEEINKYLLP